MLPSDPPDVARAGSCEDTLSALTGVRSGKNTYYRELRRTEERMTSAVRALEVVSGALVLTRDDPRTLLHEVLRATADHLGSTWTMITLRGAALPGVQERFLALGPHGRVVTSDLSLPGHLREELRQAERDTATRPSERGGWVRVPMVLDNQVVGRLIASHGPHVGDATVEPEDHWVLSILANQAALALRTAAMYSTAADLRARAQKLYDAIARNSRDLQTRTEQLEQAEDRLRQLHQRELLDAERHRIALELHDSVAQYVLSAGFAVDVCRAEAADREPGGETALRLVHARDLIATAGDQVRSVIYALNNEPGGGESASLAQLLRGVVARHRHDLEIGLRIEGRPRALSPEAVRGLARICGEALFNVVTHAKANRAAVRVRYTATKVTLTVSDDGTGEARDLRRLLRLERQGDADGRHQGLAGMDRRAEALGGRFAIRSAPSGGVRIEAALPVADDSLGGPTS